MAKVNESVGESANKKTTFETNQKEKEKSSGKTIGGRAGFVIGFVLIYLVSVGIIYSATQIPTEISKMAAKTSNAKLVLYDGPKSLKDATPEDLISVSEAERDITLKHCTDTSIKVDNQDCYVYDTNVNSSRTWVGSYMPDIQRTPITYFDFDGTVEISVKVPNIKINSVTIRPLSYNIKPEIDVKNHTVTFRVSNPDTYTVEFNNSVSRAVHIFANAIEKDKPNLKDKNVKYIGPGEWNIENIVLEDGQTLYISGGAVVHGIVNANFAKNVTVCGRGIIDNSNLEGWKGRTASIPLKFDNCQDFTIKDIISLNANAWCCQAYDTIGGKIDGLKMITARPNGDGISLQSCKSIEVKNSFVRSWDDALVVKNYDVNTNNINFKNCQVWTDLAQSMEIGYETNKGQKEKSSIENVSFEDITVLHNFHKAVMSIHNADDAAISNISYKNIVVEDANMGRGDGMANIIDFAILKNANWSSTDKRGRVANIKIDGLKVLDGADGLKTTIRGYDPDHKISNVSISGYEIKGKKVTSLDEEGITVDSITTSKVKIK